MAEKTSGPSARATFGWAIVGGAVSSLVTIAVTGANLFFGPLLGLWGTQYKDEVVASQAAPFDPAKPFELDSITSYSSVKAYALDHVVTSPSENAAILEDQIPDGAIPVDDRWDQFTLSGVGTRSIEITSIEAAGLHVDPVESATCIQYPVIGQGGESIYSFTFDLTTGEVSDWKGNPFFRHEAIPVTGSTRALIEFGVTDAPKGTVSWVYKVSILKPAPSHKIEVRYLDRLGNLYLTSAAIPASRRFVMSSEASSCNLVYGPAADATTMMPLIGHQYPPRNY